MVILAGGRNVKLNSFRIQFKNSGPDWSEFKFENSQRRFKFFNFGGKLKSRNFDRYILFETEFIL